MWKLDVLLDVNWREIHFLGRASEVSLNYNHHCVTCG